jgi:diguanylate cyclase (GGDEF)-like protein
MKTPGTPGNEEQRLATLRSLDILDTDPEERFDRLTRLARRVFDVPIALVSLVDEDRQWFKSRIGMDSDETRRDISICGHAILGDGPLIINDTLRDDRFIDNPMVTGEPGIRFYAGMPLRHINGAKLGTLCIIDREPRSLDDADLATLRDLAEMAEGELSAVHLASVDELTRICNRRGFVVTAQNCISLCARQGLPVSLVYFDLDEFKPINDRFGHDEGDRALVAFADLMQKTFRESDLFARVGGDEFVALLTNAGEKRAAEVVKRFRSQVESFNAETDRGYEIEFTDGIITVRPDERSTIGELLREADAAMYRKKRSKRSPSEFAREA